MITTDTLPAASGKGRRTTLWILSGLVALVFMGAGGAKLAGAAAMVELFAKVGLGQWLRYVTGLLEVTAGSALGARSVQQLREVAIELQIAPVRSSVHIPVATLWAHFQGGDVNKGLAELETQAQRMIDDLLWWTMALKTARNA
jgi:NAD(P)H-dependent FMN reductase